MVKTCLKAALLSAAAFGATAAAGADMKMSLWIPPVHPLMKDMEAWAASVQEAAGGDLTITLYPAAQLGAPQDHYDMASDGIAEMAMVAPGYSPGRFPIWGLIELPFTFANSTAGARALHEWYLDYVSVEMPDVRPCIVTMHHPGLVHTKGKEVRVPADLKGMRIRPAGPGTAQLVADMGGSTVQATLPEIRELSERGVIDGVTWPPDVFVVGAQDVLTTHMDAPFYVTAQIHVINKAFYDGLSDKAKAAIDSHCTPEWSAKVGKGWNDVEAASLEKLKAMPGHNVYTLTDAEKAAWAEAGAPLEAEFHKRLKERYPDQDPAAIHQALREKLKAHNAAY